MSFEKVEKKDGRNRPMAEKKADKTRSIRAGLMAIDRAMGMSIADIAEEYKISPSTVHAYLSDAEQEGLIDHYRKRMYDRLASKVCAVYEAHLDQGNLKAASEIAHGLGILQNAAPKAKEKAITTLAEWRREKEEEEDDAPVNERAG